VRANLVAALPYARQTGAGIGGIVGRAEGHAAQVADVCIVVPCVNPAHLTPHAEAFPKVIRHALVSRPALKTAATMW
jgi:D-sedoheptulose 7-phosphate isomerase